MRAEGQEARIVPPLRAVVAIPVRDEAERIGACLRAVDDQMGVQPGSIGIVLFLNNCTDGTATAIAARLPDLTSPVRVIEKNRRGATAGWARREAMDAAAAWLHERETTDGVILTTDADSRVGRDWILRNLGAIAAGADAVAGRIVLDPAEAARLPPALHARGRLEGEYESLLAELGAHLDPEEHDPWPCHWTASGATLAVRLATYRRVGGMPALALGEDRAFVTALRAQDARVRHAPEIEVVTSARLEGRAHGGAADTMRLRCEVPESPCDPQLEPLFQAAFRFLWRRRLRRLHMARKLHRTGRWAPYLAIRRSEAEAVASLPMAGQAIAAAEQASPYLASRLLRPRELKPQIRRARALLQLVRILRRIWPRAGRAHGPGPARDAAALEKSPDAAARGLVS